MRQHRLVLKNQHAELARLGEWVHALGAASGFSEKTIFRLDLALTEAVTNVIDHAYRDDTDQSIEVRLNVERESVSAEIEDSGRPYNPLARPVPSPAASLANAPEGGWGIHLIRTYTDVSRYRREGQHNILTLVINSVEA